MRMLTKLGCDVDIVVRNHGEVGTIGDTIHLQAQAARQDLRTPRDGTPIQSSRNPVMERFQYAVGLAPAEEGGFVVMCRDLPQLVTQGEDLENALAEAADAMDEVFAAYMQGGFVLPVPSKAREGEHVVSPPAETLAKAALYARSM